MDMMSMLIFWDLLHRLYNLVMGIPDNLLANSGKVADTDYYEVDKVVYSKTKTLTIQNTTSSNPQIFVAQDPSDLVPGQYCFPVGIFSYDGGTTWNDMGTDYGGSSITANLPLPTVTVSPWVSSSGLLYFYVDVNSTVGGGSTFSLICSACLLLTDSPSSISALPQISSTSTKSTKASISPTGEQIQYRRIVGKNTFTTAGVGEALTSVAHGLGYVPDMCYWMNKGWDPSSGVSSNFYSMTGGSYDIKNNQGNSQPLMFMDATNIYYADTFGGGAQNYMYRLYQP